MSEDDRSANGSRGFSLERGVTIEQLFDKQWDLQTGSFGIDFDGMTFEERRSYITYNVLALEDELHEALGEIDWKPWTNGEVFNREAFIGELVDAFHFLMNLTLAAGGDPDKVASEFVDRYLAKRAINANRQADGYDGRSNKCECGRAVEDGIPLEGYKPLGQMFYRCSGCGRENLLVKAVNSS